MSEFHVGQEFVGVYPPEAAIFATSNNLKIVESGKQGAKIKYKIVEISKSKDDVKKEISDMFKKLSKEDADCSITVVLDDQGHSVEVNANAISLRRNEILLKNFEKNNTMGKLIFIGYDNQTVLVSKEELQKIIDGIELFQIFIVQKKAELIGSVDGFTDAELQSFDIKQAFKYEYR